MGLALLGSVISILALFWGHRLGEKDGESVTNVGYMATFGVLAAVSVSSLILVVAFMNEDFSFMYVAENHSTDVSSLAWLYKLTGIWAGREGSLLFWEWLLAAFAAYVGYKRLAVTDRLSNVALAVINFVQVFFLVALFVETNNPFKATPLNWLATDGTLLVSAAMNPLLQHWAMIAHPPTMFIGYAGLTVPFAFAVAALILGDGSDKWIRLCDRITVFSWMFLGIGIGLGAVWAYVVLGWGGYWAWDPVENASILPWFTGVGLIHSFTVYRRRGGFKGWAIMLSALTFLFVLLGTFITRSGVVQSVHAFQEDPISFWLFGLMMVASVAVPAVLMIRRSEAFKSKDEFENLVSKEGSYYFNNVLMVFASTLITYWTVSSALPEWMPWGGQSFGPAAYDPIARFVGVIYVFIMAVCPILSWRKTDPATFWKRVKAPLVGTAALSAVLLYVWWTVLRPNFLAEIPGASLGDVFWHEVWAPIGLVVAALAISVSVYLFYSGAKRRAEARGESFFTALVRLASKSRQQFGGYTVHLGVGVILVGIIGSAMFVRDIRLTIPDEIGRSFSIEEYVFTYQGTSEVRMINGDTEEFAGFTVVRDGETAGVIEPSIRSFALQGQDTRNVDILVEPLRDLFFIYEGTDEAGNLSINVLINPLVTYVWVGFALLILGSQLAAWPKKAEKARAA